MKINLKKLIKKLIIFLEHKGMFNWMPDKIYLKFFFAVRLGRIPNLKSPVTFNEKIQWLKLHDRRWEYIQMVDKYEVKKYAGGQIGQDHMIPSLGIWEKFEDINFDLLPESFVLKCTHNSGGIIICKDKSSFNKEETEKRINRMLRINYFYHGREWPYKYVKPRVMAEEYMEDDSGELRDYKLMMFNGELKCSFVCTGRFNNKNGLQITVFDKDWNKMPFGRRGHQQQDYIPKPIVYDDMIKYAKALSKDIPFVRIDFYEIKGKLYFGEITFYPASGLEKFEPDEWDRILGGWIKL